MAEMKAALSQLKESAAADARFKAALKHNAAGDPQKLQTALAGLVHARELLKVALATPGLKDNIRGALQKKLDSTDARLIELEPLIAQHGLTLPTAANAARAANSGSSSVPSSPSAAAAGNPMERNLAGGAGGAAADGAPRRERTESAAWKKHQKAGKFTAMLEVLGYFPDRLLVFTAVDGLKKADAADKKLKGNEDAAKEMDLRAQVTGLYQVAEAALKATLECPGKIHKKSAVACGTRVHF